MNREPRVDEYIRDCPAEVRAHLRTVRQTIRAAEPAATEVISYNMPGYCLPGYAYKGMFAWFALQKRHIGLYLRPPTISDHAADLSGYGTTKSAVHLPVDQDVPIRLVRKLVKASVRVVKDRGR
jgi:uncharacterized protein YdhG (YjbR/CyaY superfamily)